MGEVGEHEECAFPQGYNSRHCSYCDKTRKNEKKNAHAVIQEWAFLAGGGLTKVLRTVHFPTLDTESY